METIKLTRQQLYDLVWTKPMYELCQQFGLSDNGLRKNCKKLNIPIPYIGYWSKLSARSSQANRIRSILSNYAYAGEPTGRDLVYPGIVDHSDVENAIQRLSEAQSKPKCKSKHSYLCKSILKDKITGYTMKADISHIRYMSMIGDDKQFTVSMNICDTCIWRSAYQAKWISLSTTDSDTIAKTKDQLSEISVKISNLNDILSDIDKRTEKAYTAFVSGKGRITPELYEKTLRGLENERTETLSKERLNCLTC